MPRATLSATKIATIRPTVSYVDTRGRTHTAMVTGAGGGANQLNLRVPSFKTTDRIKANVAKRTAINQTNVWFSAGA